MKKSGKKLGYIIFHLQSNMFVDMLSKKTFKKQKKFKITVTSENVTVIFFPVMWSLKTAV